MLPPHAVHLVEAHKLSKLSLMQHLVHCLDAALKDEVGDGLAAMHVQASS